jgi:myosin V
VSACESVSVGKVKHPLTCWQFAEKDIQLVVSTIVTNLAPADMVRELPGLPAHILFMCVLYADYSQNASMLQALLVKTMSAIKEAVVRHATDLNTLGFWLCNTFRLLNNMKQFSSDTQFHCRDDTLSRRLENFDLQEYRMVLSDVLVNIYHTVVKHIEHIITPLIVPAVLEFESIQGIFASTPMRSRSRAHPPQHPSINIGTLSHELMAIREVLLRLCIEPKVLRQLFVQVFYLINAQCVNTIVLRKDLCHWSKGMQIRCNLTSLEEWAHKNGLDDAKDQLIEAVQLTQLLQANKTRVEDAETIRTNCDRLNTTQIKKVLAMYTPGDGEERIPAALIRAVVDRRESEDESAAVLMRDVSHVLPVTFPFSPSDPKFPTIKLPAAFVNAFMEKI